ncbi:hypothetical protein [Haloarchaeobius sp. HRN-SO-5]|uniref:hypothetical protein n=1 Tax=Haloarchaeobius sp. HRN-SO-5 TaxID=3446118 RepID=UPI003EBE84F3
MNGFTSPFGESADTFDDAGTFVPEHLPDPGPFLADHRVLDGDEHCAVHETAADLFEERGVYDMTFGYNLARLNRDQRHPDAGYRYAVEEPAGDRSDAVLRAEFTPTTPFCPQSHTLAIGSFRAWNDLRERHEFDRVRIRVHPMHHRSSDINDTLATLGERFAETGSVPDPADVEGVVGSADGSAGTGGRRPDLDAPF